MTMTMTIVVVLGKKKHCAADRPANLGNVHAVLNCTLLCVCYVLCYVLCVTCYVLRVTCYVLCVTCYVAVSSTDSAGNKSRQNVSKFFFRYE